MREPFVTLANVHRALDDIQTPNGVQASDFHLFKAAVFGRDSLQVGFDVVRWLPSLTRRIIFSLARLQAREDNPLCDALRGKMHHEFRQLYIGGERIGREQQAILQELGERWDGRQNEAGEFTELCYYGGIDTTPDFIRLVADYCQLWGPSILNTPVEHYQGESYPLSETVLECVGFIMRQTAASDLGLLEFKRATPQGHRYQVMRDGADAYLHSDGTLANVEAPIASLEVQGLAYDALVMAAELLPRHADADNWRQRAKEVKNNTLKRFWLPRANRFAMAIDRDEAGSPRLVTTNTSVPFELLDTGLFDSLDINEKYNYLRSIVTAIFSEEFLTPVGVRMRGRSEAHLVPYCDYQGSEVSWVVTTNRTARGLRRQGWPELGEVLEERFVAGLNLSRQFVEYWYVDTGNRVAYEPLPARDITRREVVGTNIPENTQAWTVSAAYRALHETGEPLHSDLTTRQAGNLTWHGELGLLIQDQLREPLRVFVDRDQARQQAHNFIGE